jgi:hypothetical protein
MIRQHQILAVHHGASSWVCISCFRVATFTISKNVQISETERNVSESNLRTHWTPSEEGALGSVTKHESLIKILSKQSFFSQGYERLYSIYVHAHPSFYLDVTTSNSTVFRGRNIPSKEVSRERTDLQASAKNKPQCFGKLLRQVKRSQLPSPSGIDRVSFRV